MRLLNGKHPSEKMFESLGNAIREEQEKLAKKQQWIHKLMEKLEDEQFLVSPFQEKQLIHPIKDEISKLTKVAGIDGGIISEAMTGFDLALYRAVGAVFSGIGKKIEAKYVPHFDPDPQIFFSPSLSSRNEFNRICTLMRLYTEYEVAKLTITQENPTVIFIDGKVAPLQSDFSVNYPAKLVIQAEQDVKQIYQELIELAFEHDVLLCGLVKDSRSREYTTALGKIFPEVMKNYKLEKKFMQLWPYMMEDLQDSFLGETLLSIGERTAWLKSSLPSWVKPELHAELWTCLVKPVEDDQPVRLEIIVNSQEKSQQKVAEIALGALRVLTGHGMSLAIPTVILEADERTKLSIDHLDAVIDQIALSLGLPREQLRKRRYYSSSMSRL